MSSAVYTKFFADSRRGLLAWAIGAAVVGMGYASTYPDQKDNTESLPAGLRDSLHVDATAAGYLQAAVFGLILPLLLMIYGIAAGLRATASDEESGQLDLLLAHPVTRTKVVLQRFASVATGALVISFVIFLALLAIRTSAELDSITAVEFLAQCVNLFLLSVTFAALAFGLGTAFGSKVITLAGSSAVGVVAYTANSLYAQIGDGIKYLSPMYYYIGGEPLRNGFQWGDIAILVILSAIFLGIGTVRFNRRDVNC
ncbi:ABC transporter permease subunit [Streptomyces sp. NPDC085944]|uniref:ABC transporter permease subunit n=1 Tax=Streptomyces sp. NPDC085944 TaxID=3154962 RepID=UPI0034190789